MFKNGIQKLNTFNIKPFNSKPVTNPVAVEVNFPKSDKTPEELCKEYGISLEDFYKLSEECKKTGKDIYSLTPEDINSFLAKQNATTTPEKDEKAAEKEAKTLNTTISSKDFVNLADEAKMQVIVQMLAKNNYMHSGDKRTEEDWNALSDAERNQYVEQYKPHLKEKVTKIYNLLSNDKTDDFSKIESKLSKYVDGKDLNKAYTVLLAIENQGLNIEDLVDNKKVKVENVEEWVHEYLFNQPVDTLTEGQQRYVNTTIEYSKAVNNYAKKNDPNSSYATLGQFSMSEMKEYAKSQGISLDRMQIDYLCDQCEMSDDMRKAFDIMLSKSGKERYYALKEAGLENAVKEFFKATNETKKPTVKVQLLQMILGKMGFDDIPASGDSKIYSEMMSDKSYKDLMSSNIDDKSAKVDATFKLFNEKCKQLSPVEYANNVYDFLQGLKFQSDDSDFAFMFYGKILQNASDEQKTALNELLKTNSINLAHANNYDKSQSEKLAKYCAESDNALPGIVLLWSADDEHYGYVNQKMAGAKNEAVQMANVDRNFYVKDAELQFECSKNIAKYSSSEARGYAASNADKLNEKYQVDSLGLFIKGDKLATDMANESGVVSRMAVQNQTKAFNTVKNSIEELWENQDAIDRLNTLSDQIQNCDVSNQLDMHNSIMSSQYSEVQEHAAGNVGNYDPSVQSSAMDTVYKTGNQKAIDAGTQSVMNNPKSDAPNDSVKYQETVRNICEKDMNSASERDLYKRFLGGNLTYQEVKDLPATQRRQYMQKYFEKLPLNQKVKLLSSIKDMAMQKMIYPMIARVYPNLFKEICSNSDRVDNLLSLGLDEHTNNKIIENIKKMAYSGNKDFIKLALAHDIDYDANYLEPEKRKKSV